MQSSSGRKVHIQKLQYKEMGINQHREQELKKLDMAKMGINQKKINKGNLLWKGQTKLLTYEQVCKSSSMPTIFGNGFFSAVYHAYCNHGDIKFTPDDVWIAIMLYFSEYVNNNAEKLRSAFVTHEGQKKLKVQNNIELLQTQWDEFFTLMIEEIKKNTTKGVTETFECDFTTTGRVEKIISTAVIMNTYKKYFTYTRIMSMCGIQNVHFDGTLQDWKKILYKTKELKGYDVDGKLKQYITNVSIILQKFIETYEGKVDVSFWNKIVHVDQEFGSGATTEYSGWITHLFGYTNPVEEVKMQEISFDIKVVNRITNVTKTVNLVGGFRAVAKQGCVYRPHLSMAIFDAPLDKQRPVRPQDCQ